MGERELPGKERRVRGQRLWVRRDRTLEDDALARQLVDARRTLERLAVGPQGIGPRGIERNQDQVEWTRFTARCRWVPSRYRCRVRDLLACRVVGVGSAGDATKQQKCDCCQSCRHRFQSPRCYRPPDGILHQRNPIGSAPDDTTPQSGRLHIEAGRISQTQPLNGTLDTEASARTEQGGQSLEKIRIAIVGVGNCASSLVQGLEYYRDKRPEDAVGLMHWEIGGYRPSDLEVVTAFDIDVRKVGKDVNEAVFEQPNCTETFCPNLPKRQVKVRMGRLLDGVASHMRDHADHHTFLPSDAAEPTQADVVRTLQRSGAEILINYLPVGAERAARFYAECALEAGCALVNCIPVFIASDPTFARRFEARGLPIIGDDIKAQLGATITHRTLTDLFRKRGVKLERTYQLNTGGNTDFLNMLNRDRLASKKISKTEAVQSVAAERLEDENIHVGPSDFVPWQKDNKVCFLRMEGKLFGEVPMHLELRLSVEDSPNSAGVSIDAIRCAKLGLDRGLAGPLVAPSACFMKHPPRQFSDDQAHDLVEAFITGREAR